MLVFPQIRVNAVHIFFPMVSTIYKRLPFPANMVVVVSVVSLSSSSISRIFIPYMCPYSIAALFKFVQ